MAFFSSLNPSRKISITRKCKAAPCAVLSVLLFTKTMPDTYNNAWAHVHHSAAHTLCLGGLYCLSTKVVSGV